MKIPESEKRTNALTVYLNDDEVYMIKKWKENARSKSISDFLRNAMYMVGCCQIQIRTDNRDIQQIPDALNLFCHCVLTTIDELLKHDEVEMEDIEHIRLKMDKIYDTVQACYSMLLAERNDQRQKAEKYLTEWVNNILGIS